MVKFVTPNVVAAESPPRTPQKRSSEATNEKCTPETTTPDTENESQSLSPSKRQKSDYYDAVLLKSLILQSLQGRLAVDASKGDIQLNGLINIGSGSFSQVYRATIMRQVSSNAGSARNTSSSSDDQERLFTIAIKVITTQSSASRMLREADILKKAGDMAKRGMTCIMPIISMFLGERAGYTGIVQPYVPHLPFESYYTKLDNDQVRGYMRSLLTAIQTVHTLGYVHRDIKPANFIYIPNHNAGYLIDFGLAEPIPVPVDKTSKVLQTSSRQNLKASIQLKDSAKKAAEQARIEELKKCGCDPNYDRLCNYCWSRPREKQERSGTPGYRSPEILQKSEDQGPPIDMWAAGCILIQILTGRAPFFPPKEEPPPPGLDAPAQPLNPDHKNLDSDAVCFSDQLSFCGIPAMTQAMDELKLVLRLSEKDKQNDKLTHEYTMEYIKETCTRLRRDCGVEYGDPEPVFDSVLYELVWRLLCPAYSQRIDASTSLELLCLTE